MQLSVKVKLTSFLSSFPTRKYPKGQLLIHPEDTHNLIYYLQSGRVKQYCLSDVGSEVVVNVCRDRTLFPDYAVLELHTGKNSYYFDALTDVEVRVIPAEKLKAFVAKNNDVMLEFLYAAQKKVETMSRKMAYMSASTAYYRLLNELVYECQQSQRHTKKSTQPILLPMYEYELASQTGLSRETANRELKKLKQKNLVAIHNKYIMVKDFLRLKRELGSHF